MTSSLTVGPYRAWVRLGCLPEERQTPQAVDMTLTMRFRTIPKGCETDELVDTFCYADLCEILRSVCSKKEYKLIESLAMACVLAMTESLPPGDFEFCLHKLTPPVENLHGGAKFTLSFSK